LAELFSVLVFVVPVGQGKKHFVFQAREVDFYVLTMHENIYRIQLVQNSLQLIVIDVDDQVHVCVNVECKAKNRKNIFRDWKFNSTYGLYFTKIRIVGLTLWWRDTDMCELSFSSDYFCFIVFSGVTKDCQS
jgi:hypothetical protein